MKTIPLLLLLGVALSLCNLTNRLKGGRPSGGSNSGSSATSTGDAETQQLLRLVAALRRPECSCDKQGSRGT